MKLKTVHVEDLPLSSDVAYAKDIQSYVSNMLSDMSFSTDGLLDMELGDAVVLLAQRLGRVIQRFGGTAEGGLEPVVPPSATYTVTFKDWDGTVLATRTVQKGGAATAPRNPTREGYAFAGWDKPFSNVTSNIVVTARYSRVAATYAVTFEDWDGTVLATRTVQEGQAAQAPSNPSRTGYRFAGWDIPFSNVTSNLVVTATYAVLTCAVVFLDFDGVHTVDVKIVNYGEAVVPPEAPAVEGWTFVGWDKDLSSVTEDAVTVRPVYERVVCEVRFVGLDGRTIKVESVPYGQAATAPDGEDVAEDGYRFTGWDAGFDDVRSNLTVTAVYERIQTFTVTFEDWDGTVLLEARVEEGGTVVPPSDPSREGYWFTGWSTNAFSNIQQDMTVTAVYQRMTFTVTFVGEGGEEISSATVYYGEDAVPPEAPEVESRRFVGWAGGSYQNVTSNQILTAQYVDEQATTWTVTFLGMDGQPIGDPQVVEDGDAAAPPAPPEVEGWEFAGWDRDFSNVTSDLVVRATYEPAQTTQFYTVRFVYGYNGLDICEPQRVERGGDAAEPQRQDPEGMTFVRWEGSWTNVTEDRTITAVYETTVHVVSFFDWDETPLGQRTVAHGANVTDPPSTPGRTGYELTGWTASYFGVVQDLSTYAQYSPMSYVVSFDAQGGECELTGKTVTYGQPYGQLPSATFSGNDFGGWWTEPLSGGTRVAKMSTVRTPSNHTLYAAWTASQAEEHVVRFWSDESLIKTSTVQHGADAEPPEDPEKPGYDFAGWTGSYLNVTEDRDLSATWTEAGPITHTVLFIDGFNNEVISSVTVSDGGDVGAFPDAPEHEGQIFFAWTLDGKNVTTDIDIVALYRELEEGEVGVSFDPRGGETQNGIRGKKVVTGQPYGQLPDATLSGYEFEGWWTDPRNGEAVSAGTVVSAETNHTLYAHWWDGNPFHDESLPTDDEVGQAAEDAEGEEYEPGDEPEGDDPSSWPQPPADYIFNLSADEYDEDLEPADGSIDEGGEFPATDQQLSDFIAAMNGEGPEITSEQEQEENAVQAARQLDPDDECEDEPEQQTSGYAEPEWNPDFMFGVGGDQPETFQREYETYAVTGDSEPHSSEDTDSFVRMLSGGVVITSGED